MNLLQQKISERIRNEGWITFRSFMEMALYDPEFGYYTSGNAKIGRQGDFYTSSHLHPVFGTMIGKQIEEMWEIMGRPSDFAIVEMGAGAGYLCKDMLDYYKGIEGSREQGVKEKRNFFKCIQYIIIELNPAIREHQKKLLADYPDKIRWVSSLKELHNIRGCLLSNELLDAFPVHLIEMENEIKEIYVIAEGGKLKEIKDKPGSDDIPAYLREFSIDISFGYRTEINLDIRKWISDVTNILSEGFVLTIDYGYPAWDYYCEDRNRGTLLCYSGHEVIEDPYRNPGEQDLTAHVNFTSLKKWGNELGLRTMGFCQQGAFLMSLGIDGEIARIHQNSSDYHFEVARIKRLILPGTLGETHKVMIQYKGNSNPGLGGFSIKNQADRL